LFNRIRGFDWDIRNRVHIWEHGVNALEAEEVFFDKPVYLKHGRDRYVVFGVTEEGRYLFVVFCRKDKNLIRIITAREMTQKEKRSYKKRRGFK